MESVVAQQKRVRGSWNGAEFGSIDRTGRSSEIDKDDLETREKEPKLLTRRPGRYSPARMERATPKGEDGQTSDVNLPRSDENDTRVLIPVHIHREDQERPRYLPSSCDPFCPFPFPSNAPVDHNLVAGTEHPSCRKREVARRQHTEHPDLAPLPRNARSPILSSLLDDADEAVKGLQTHMHPDNTKVFDTLSWRRFHFEIPNGKGREITLQGARYLQGLAPAGREPLQ